MQILDDLSHNVHLLLERYEALQQENARLKEDIEKLIRRAITDKECGMGVYKAEITDEAVTFLADMAGGDARHALNAVELAVLTTPRAEDGIVYITLVIHHQLLLLEK